MLKAAWTVIKSWFKKEGAWVAQAAPASPTRTQRRNVVEMFPDVVQEYEEWARQQELEQRRRDFKVWQENNRQLFG